VIITWSGPDIRNAAAKQKRTKADPPMTEPLSTDAILDALSATNGVLPRAAMQQAIARWPEVGPVLLTRLNAAIDSTDISQREGNLLCMAIYLMAQVQDHSAYRPLCTLLMTGDRGYDLIGDGVTEDLKFILAWLYDGDSAPLRTLIEATGANEFTRDAALNAFAWLTATGRIDREEAVAYFRDLHASLQPQAACYVWVSWLLAIANLGLEELSPLVEDVFQRGWIDDTILSVEDFRNDLAAAKQAGGLIAGFPPQERYDGRLDDVAHTMSNWQMFQPQKPTRQTSLPAPDGGTVRNQYRGVGRNDPCPCGSGKKFKKCCLELVR
jgi:hypothetical protein